MPTFTDRFGRSWEVDLTVASLRRIRSLAGIDLLELQSQSSQLLGRLLTDPVLLVDVLYAACKPQADERSLTDEQFGEALAGDPIEQASTALLDAYVSFTPNPIERAAIGRVIQAVRELMQRRRADLEREIPRLIEQLLATPGDSSGAAPASSASTPGP